MVGYSRHRVLPFTCIALALTTGVVQGQTPGGDSLVSPQEIARNLVLFASPRGNLLVRTGTEDSFVAGTHYPELVSAAVAWLERHQGPPVRFAFVGVGPGAAAYADGRWTMRGATTIAQEAWRYRIAAILQPDSGKTGCVRLSWDSPKSSS